ncbi:MAG: LytTR family DNA-binding domain-containing protein [Deltaproteobacteria bacterium]|nr:LytTR family DNA-binding domain-containing protein [Kofleriaceae bacterium]
MIRALVVDDEPLARETVRLVLAQDPDVVVVGACTGVDAVAAVEQHRPDLLVLDVQMPEVDGFDVVEAIGPDAVPAIVFVTAYDQYAVRAFEVRALDYVLKPFDDRRLLAALARAKEALAARRSIAGQLAELLLDRERARGHLRRFAVRRRDRIVLVDASEVDSIEAADDYVELHAGGAVHVVRERMAELEARLDPARFVRIHRSVIVNVERVREIHPLVRGDALVVLEGGASFRCSRGRRAELDRRLTDSPRRRDHSPQRS